MESAKKMAKKQIKTFLISSPAYKANGLNGTYVSIAITDEAGNVLKGFGDHISNNSYGIKNVFDAEGTHFSDEDRIISIKEVEFSEEDMDSWISAYNERQEHNNNIYEEMEKRFGSETYTYINASKDGQEQRRDEVDFFRRENPIKESGYYSFLEIVK